MKFSPYIYILLISLNGCLVKNEVSNNDFLTDTSSTVIDETLAVNPNNEVEIKTETIQITGNVITITSNSYNIPGFEFYIKCSLTKLPKKTTSNCGGESCYILSDSSTWYATDADFVKAEYVDSNFVRGFTPLSGIGIAWTSCGGLSSPAYFNHKALKDFNWTSFVKSQAGSIIKMQLLKIENHQVTIQYQYVFNNYHTLIR